MEWVRFLASGKLGVKGVRSGLLSRPIEHLGLEPEKLDCDVAHIFVGLKN